MFPSAFAISLVRMSNNTVDLTIDSEVKTSYGLSPDSPRPSLGNDHIGAEITSISEDFDSGRVSENSLEEDNSSFESLETFIPNVGGIINHTEVFMPLISCRKGRYIPICNRGTLLDISFKLSYRC